MTECDESKLYTIVTIPGAGRGLQATRDIERGEVILSAEAAVTGPCFRSPPSCVVCLKLTVPSIHNFCSKCCLLVCSKACSNSPEHEVECKILSLVKAKMKRSKGGEKLYKENLSSLTGAVTCIRLISLKWREPSAWSLVSSLMDQNINESVWQDLNMLHEKILHHESRISLEDLRLAHGVLSTNGALLHLPPGFGRGVAVYPMQALLNHSCMCNTTSQDYPQERRVEIKARFKIKKGEEITTSYIRPTQDTQSRRELLAHTWHFWCSCARCSDPTEGGSFLAAIKCPLCPSERVLPNDPLDTDTDWTCEKCDNVLSAEKHQQLLCQALEIINSYPKDGITHDQLEEMLQNLTKFLSSTHWLMIEIQQKLLNVYINFKNNCSREIKERRIQLCERILLYMDKVDPENKSSAKKLQISQIKLDTKLDLMTKDFKDGKLSKEDLAAALMEKKKMMVNLSKEESLNLSSI